MELIKDANRGPLARYSDAHLFLVLDLLDREGRMSRQSLAEETGLGEGSVRSMVEALKCWRWINVEQKGITLTDFGRTAFHGFGIRYVEVTNRKYAVGKNQQGIIVENAADQIRNGMAQRDLAVRHGAAGASVFVMIGGNVIFPVNWNLDEKDPNFAAEIRGTGMKEGDVLIIVDSDDFIKAKVVAAAVGLAMR